MAPTATTTTTTAPAINGTRERRATAPTDGTGASIGVGADGVERWPQMAKTAVAGKLAAEIAAALA